MTEKSYFILEIIDYKIDEQYVETKGKWFIFEGTNNILVFNWYNCEFEQMSCFKQIGMAGKDHVLSSNEIKNVIAFISIKNSASIKVSYIDQLNNNYIYNFAYEK